MMIIPTDEYEIFGPGSVKSNPLFISKVEQEVEAKCAVNRMSSKLLIKMGKIGGTTTMTGFIPKGLFRSISNKLSLLESTLEPRPSDVDWRNKVQSILHVNLILE